MNCDRIASWYRWLEYGAFGKALERRRFCFLREAAGARRALVIGDGDGRFLGRWVSQNPEASVDCIDLSPRMLDLARRRAGAGRVAYLQADVLTSALPGAPYDLITTHFVLDCLDDLQADRLIGRVARASQPDARWLVSEFRVPRSGWRRACARFLIAFLYRFFRLTTGLRVNSIVDYHPLFARHGFRLVRAESGCLGLLVSELWRAGLSPVPKSAAADHCVETTTTLAESLEWADNEEVGKQRY